MPELKRLKTLLLGMAVILITFTIFIALPATLPSFESLSCKKLSWACTHRCTAPVYYRAEIWGTPKIPDIQTIIENLRSAENKGKITSKLPSSLEIGRLNLVIDPENESHVTVSGYLLYGISKEAEIGPVGTLPVFIWKGVLPHRTIKLSILSYYKENSEFEYLKLTTDMDGFFSTDIEFTEIPECYIILAEYDGDAFDPWRPMVTYLPCYATYSNCSFEFEFKEPGIPWWVWLIIGLVISGIGFLIYWYSKHRRKRVPGIELLPQAEEIEIPKATEKKEGDEAGGDFLLIEISFPNIEVSFPAVWGASDPLTVMVQLKDVNNEAIASQLSKVEFGDGEIVQAISNSEGYIRLEHTFTSKNEYVITVSYTEERRGKEISSWRKIRIVEYREEMVRLFNDMLETMNIRDIKIDPEMTAREVEVLLEEKLKGISTETIGRVVAGFEEANYSVHPVTRESYVAMYPAISEVLGYGR